MYTNVKIVIYVPKSRGQEDSYAIRNYHHLLFPLENTNK